MARLNARATDNGKDNGRRQDIFSGVCSCAVLGSSRKFATHRGRKGQKALERCVICCDPKANGMRVQYPWKVLTYDASIRRRDIICYVVTRL